VNMDMEELATEAKFAKRQIFLKIIGDPKLKTAEVFKKKQAVVVLVQNAIEMIGEVIELCESDDSDGRYDLLHEIKNKLLAARKRLRRVSDVEPDGR